MKRKIKWLVMDIDGTMTDGGIYVGSSGEVMKRFHVRDGYGIAHELPQMGIRPVIITGRNSEIVSARARELHIEAVYQGVGEKLEKLKELAEADGILPEEIAYIGDDVNDLSCIRYCGMTACPRDAMDEVKKEVDYVCKTSGGHGAVREFIDVMKR